jgi:hypothetical protein
VTSADFPKGHTEMFSRRHSIAALLAVTVAIAAPAAAARTQTGASVGWHTWWGSAAYARGAIALSSHAPARPAETHSALETTTTSSRDYAFSFKTTTLAQLRAGSRNPWEVGWAMFRFRDPQNYYYFILKTNGYELGKKQGSDAQHFLVTGDDSKLAIGRSYRIQIEVRGPRIEVFVDGRRIIDFVDPNPLRRGAVGVYEEDAKVRFESISVTAAT